MRAALIALAAVGALAAAGCASQTTGTASGPVSAPGTPSSTSTSTSTSTGASATSGGAPATVTQTGEPSSPHPTPTPTPTSARCHTRDLTGSLTEQGAAAGSRYAGLVLTNVSGRTCTLFGYGGIQLATASRQPLPTIQVRDTVHPPKLVRLAPGARASATLGWGVVPSGTEPVTGPCEPQPSLLLVIPPDETTQLSVPWLSGPVCQHGRIVQWAYAAGVVPP